MANSMKRPGPGAAFKLLGAVAGAAGLVVMAVCNSMGTDYQFSSATLLYAGAAGGAVLALAGGILPLLSFDARGWLGTLCSAGAAFLLAFTAIQAISGRILLISGLYSWNSMNTVGWTTFYLSIGVVACLVAGAVIVVVGSFLPATAKAKAAV